MVRVSPGKITIHSDCHKLSDFDFFALMKGGMIGPYSVREEVFITAAGIEAITEYDKNTFTLTDTAKKLLHLLSTNPNAYLQRSASDFILIRGLGGHIKVAKPVFRELDYGAFITCTENKDWDRRYAVTAIGHEYANPSSLTDKVQSNWGARLPASIK
jgi:hypothetical protein